MQRISYYIFLLLSIMLFAASCANRGVGPQGGPKDSIPPVIVKEYPANGTVNFHEQVVSLQCNEYLQLNDVANQVLISPPQKRPPIVKAVGKKVTVTFEDPLADSTTYTIQFGSAICDNNERNPIVDYSFSFSTGPVIDSLELSGILINAADLNPMSGVYVGVHSDLSDTALASFPFRSIARTNEEGYFRLTHLHEGKYHIFALNDVSKDFLYQPGEGLAFLDTLFTPVAPVVPVLPVVPDSLENPVVVAASDSLENPVVAASDSVREYFESTSREEPLILLRYFEEDKQRHYLQRCNRDEQHSFVLLFAAPQDSMPVIEWQDSIRPDAFLVQSSARMDTITVWITDSMYITRDTLPFLLTYQLSDSLYNLVWQTDTVNAIYRAPRISDKAKASVKKKTALECKSNASNTFDIYQSLQLQFATPVALMQPDSIHFYQMVDTVKQPLEGMLEKADSAGMTYRLKHDWQALTQYVLEVDSAAFTDIYGASSLKQQFKWTIRSLDEYSTLTIKVSPYDADMYVQLLSEKDEVVRTLHADSAGTKFEYLKPATYYVRAYLDLNGDSVWTTGDYLHHRQPEPVFYFSNKLTLRANWEFEETLHYLDKDILEQKPQEIKKDAGNKKK